MCGKNVNKSKPEKCNDPKQRVGREAGLFLGRPPTGHTRTGGEILCRSDGTSLPVPPSSPNQNTSTGVDWISGLPDDILVGILSTLPLKEAARTSILSPRWENLWKHTSRLDFDADAALHRIIKHGDNNPKVRTLETRKYINWVNKVLLRSYKGFALKELRICFDLDKPTAQKSINRWLRFAFERRVERLELDLSKDGCWPRCSNVYALPRKMFKPHQPRSLFDSLKYLKALSFKTVDLSDRDVDVILRSCPLLEHLVIQHANTISNLNICGAPALKHLEIIFCVRIKSQKISAPNLISLKVTNAETLLLENVPKLVDFDVCSRVEKVHLVLALFDCPSQLEILTLDLLYKKETMENFNKCQLHQLPKLKKLEIVFYGKDDESMIGLITPLMRVAPNLQQLVIKMKWSKLLRTNRNFKNVLNSTHQHLKVVKFLGYYGRSSDEELVRYLLDNCVVLETLIIDPRYQPDFPHCPLNLDEIDGELTREKRSTIVYPEEFDGLVAVKTSRKCAKKQLIGQIPQRVHLVIL